MPYPKRLIKGKMPTEPVSRRDAFRLGLAAAAAGVVPWRMQAAEPSTGRRTRVTIQGDSFYINDKPTYEGRFWNDCRVEGLLFNLRTVQATFDDLNPETRSRWIYPDTGLWDPERNTREFLAAMPAWREHGLLSFTLNLQGGSPEGYSNEQPWHNSALDSRGNLRPEYMARFERVLDFADQLGMTPITGIFYFGQDERLEDEAAVVRAVDNYCDWLLERRYVNVLIELNNECDIRYNHEILKPQWVHELIARVRKRGFLCGTSYGGGKVPDENVIRASDFILLHGNGVSDPERIAAMVREVRQAPAYEPKPILFNEDDHFEFDQPKNNFLAAVGEYASWGYFEGGKSNYRDGFQSPPVDWKIGTPRKVAFFNKLKEITGN